MKEVQELVMALTYSNGKHSGFYMQDTEEDGDLTSSNALYVYGSTGFITALLSTTFTL